MDLFYLLQKPKAPPSAPRRWSYSDLLEWRTCPHRWWLLRAKYPNTVGRYPTQISPATLQGIVVHETIKAYALFLRTRHANNAEIEDASYVFPIRDTMRRKLLQILKTECANNPRIKPTYLKSQVSLDDCVNHVKRIISSYKYGQRQYHGIRYGSSAFQSKQVNNGHEILIEVDTPPMSGRPDLILDGRIIDFKSGIPEPSHADQLRYYGLLYWLKFGYLPKSLELNYSHLTSTVLVEVPNEVFIRDLCQCVAKEIEQFHSIITSAKTPKACPGQKCRYCPVRQHCDPYWSAPETIHLRDVGLVDSQHETKNYWVDTELYHFNHSVRIGQVYHSEALSEGLGSVSISVDLAQCPNVEYPCLIGARILGACFSYSNNRWSLSVGPYTEIFWMI